MKIAFFLVKRALIFLLVYGPKSSTMTSINPGKLAPTQEDITELWSTLENKPTPIYKCEGWYGGNKVTIPKPPDCTMPESHDMNKMVDLSLYLPDINRQTITGYECYAVKKSEWISRNFFDARRSGSATEYFRVSEKSCWNMVLNRKSPLDENLDGEKGGIIGTSNKLVIDSYWMRNISGSVVNYFFREVTVSVYDLDKSILTSTDIKKPCKFNDTSCATTLGLLVWKSLDFKTCRLTEVGLTTCLFSQRSEKSRITCPDLQLSLNGISEISMCDLTFGISSQGYYFLPKEKSEINENYSSNYEAAEKITRPHKREKRDADNTNTMDYFINGKFNYLYESLKDKTEESFQIVHKDICQTNYMLWTFMYNVASLGNPSMLVQVLYNDPSLRAMYSGDVLSVWQCISLSTYKFLKRDKCFLEWPIIYLHQGRQHMSFLSPVTHVITDNPAAVQEPCAEFYFDASDYVLHLTEDGPLLVNFPSLPQPNLGTKDITFPELSFNSTSGIEVSGFSDFMHTRTMFHELQTRNDAIKKISDNVEEIEHRVAPLDVMSTMGKGLFSFWSSIFSFSWNIFSYFKYILVLAVIGLVVWGILVVSGPSIFVRGTSNAGIKVLSLFFWPLKKLFRMTEHSAYMQRQNNPDAVDVPTVIVGAGDENSARLRVAPSGPPLYPPVPSKGYSRYQDKYGY